MRRTPQSIRHHLAFAILTALASGAPVIATARPIVLEEIAKIVPPGPDDQLVIQVAMSGNHLLIGTRRNFPSTDGFRSEQFAYLYSRSDAGVWTYSSTLASVNEPHETIPPLTLGINGDIVAINLGQLMIFERVGTEWLQTATLATTRNADLEIDGGRILVRGPDCSWNAFRKETAGWRAFATARAAMCSGGFDVDISGEIIVASSALIPTGVEGPSKVLIFQGLSSQHPAALVTDPLGDEPLRSGLFGQSVAMGGITMFAARLRPRLRLRTGGRRGLAARCRSHPPRCRRTRRRSHRRGAQLRGCGACRGLTTRPGGRINTGVSAPIRHGLP